MQIVLTSDSHGRGELLDEIQKWYPRADLYLNCGDLEESPARWPDWIFVRGNNDYFAGQEMPEERILTVGSHKLLLLHSHRFPYAKREQAMAQYALKKGCDIVCYGHTHIAKISIVDSVVLVNPGSLWMSRNGKSPSFAVIDIKGEQVEAKIIYEEDWPPLPQKKKKEKKRFWF